MEPWWIPVSYTHLSGTAALLEEVLLDIFLFLLWNLKFFVTMVVCEI